MRASSKSPLEKYVTYTIEAKSHEILVAEVSLDLQRFFQKAQRSVILPVVVIQVAEVHECVGDTFVIANLALQLQSFLVILQRDMPLPQPVLELGGGV